MNITLNGKITQTEAKTVASLLCELHIKQEAVVVEKNKKIIKQEEFHSCNIANNDHIELVTIVGGG